ncbi:hypothetical protein ACFW04_013911 [Cataglyphis niger]
MDALSDYSEDSDTQVHDYEFNEDDSIIVPIHQGNRRILLSDSEDDIVSCDYEDIIVNSVDDWSENDMELELKAYDRTPSVNMILHDQENVLEIIQLFLGNDLFELLVTKTNRYRSQVLNKYKSMKWVDVTIREMKKFLDNTYDYWSTSSYIETPIFSKTMSRNRFMQRWQMWRFCNNDLMHDKSDKLFKIRNQELSLDEGIIPWRGRLSFRTYNSAKLTKYGILVRMLCEGISGYICNFEIYSGSGAKLQDIVLSILHPFVGFHHHIYMDNYYNSVNTAELLLQKKRRVCGTIRENRGIPSNLKNITLKKHETKFAKKGSFFTILASKERPTSQNHFNYLFRRNGKGYTLVRKKIKPKSINISYYSILRKSTKWTKKAMLNFFNAALFNSFLAEPSSAIERIRPAPRYDPPARLSQDFKKTQISTNCNGWKIKYPHRKYRVCSARKVIIYIYLRYIYEYCNVPLHKLTCFERYHTVKKY